MQWPNFFIVLLKNDNLNIKKVIVMVFPVTCIDNFYEDPDSVVQFAHSLEFTKMPGIYPGLRTDVLYNINESFFNAFCGKLLSLFFDFNQAPVNWNVQTAFQKIYPVTDDGDELINSGWIHLDSSCIAAGVIYLNDDTNIKAGTSMYQMKYPELCKEYNDKETKYLDYGNNTARIDFYDNKEVDMEEYRKKKIEHEELFEKTLDIGNVYNRLVLYDIDYWHKESSFIMNGTDPRLTQVFFISSVEAGSFPIQRKRQYKI